MSLIEYLIRYEPYHEHFTSKFSFHVRTVSEINFISYMDEFRIIAIVL